MYVSCLLLFSNWYFSKRDQRHNLAIRIIWELQYIIYHFSSVLTLKDRILVIEVLWFEHAASCGQDFTPRKSVKRGSMINPAIGVTLISGGGRGGQVPDPHRKERVEMNLVDLCCRENDQMARWLNKECKIESWLREWLGCRWLFIQQIHSHGPSDQLELFSNPGVELFIAQSGTQWNCKNGLTFSKD